MNAWSLDAAHCDIFQKYKDKMIINHMMSPEAAAHCDVLQKDKKI